MPYQNYQNKSSPAQTISNKKSKALASNDSNMFKQAQNSIRNFSENGDSDQPKMRAFDIDNTQSSYYTNYDNIKKQSPKPGQA